MLSNELNSLQEELHYHRVAIEELEQKIAEAKSYSSLALEASDAVQSVIENIGDPRYLTLFREHLISLFPQEKPKYLEENPSDEDVEYMDDSNPDYKSIEQIQEEDPDNIVVFHSEEHIKETEEKKEKSYFELTGRPDLRPTTYDDLAPNITYSSSGRAYIGFNDYEEAEKFREGLTVPSLLDKAEIMNGFKWELKFYCDRQYLEGLIEKSNNFEQISPAIVYNHNDSITYVAFNAKGRADNYGSYLTRILNIAEKYSVSNKPQIIKESKYELRLEQININDATHLASFNLKKDWDASENKEVREVWRTTRKREIPPSYTPNPQSTPITELEAGDIVKRPCSDAVYQVLGMKKLEGQEKLYAEVECLEHPNFPGHIGEMFFLDELILLERKTEKVA